MTSLKIRVYAKHDDRPKTAITIPLAAVGIAAKVLPRGVREDLAKSGIDVGEIVARVRQENFRGKLIEIEKGSERTVVSVE